MSTEVRSGLAESMHAPKGASGSGGKRPRKGNGGRRPPRDKPVIGKKRQAEACKLCRKTDHKKANCPYMDLLINVIRTAAASEAPVRPRDRRHPPAHQRRPRQEGPTARDRRRDRRRAARQARREDPEQAPEREEPQEDIEEETEEALQREREQTGGPSQVTRQNLRLDSPD